MSSARQGLQIVGSIAGAFFGGPLGGAIGGAIGGEVGGFIDGPPEGPKLDDLTAPQLEFGSKVPRLYGTVWCTLSPRWWSGLRESSEVQGGKGGDAGVETFSYHADLFGVLGEVDLTRWPNPVWTRIRIDGKVKASRLAGASDETLAAADDTEDWSDAELFTGDAAQAPWSVMEAAEGIGSTNAYRGQLGFAFTNLLMPNGRRPSLIEIEIATEATSDATDPLTLLQSDFSPDSADDSYFAHGAATLTGGPSLGAEGFSIDTTLDNQITAHWTASADLPPNGSDAWTIEGFITPVALEHNVAEVFVRVVFGNGDTHQFDWHGTDYKIEYQTNRYFGVEGASGAMTERTHWALVFGGGNDTVAYIGGVPIFSVAGGMPAAQTSAIVYIGRLVTGTPGATIGRTAWSIDSFRVRREEVYTAAFTPPDTLDPPDFPLESLTPVPADLQDVLEAEMLRCQPLEAGDIDMSAAAGKLVRGFKAADAAARTCAVLLDWFYLELYCADQIVCVERGGAVEQTVAHAYTGSGVGGPAEPFAGLTRGNDLEVPVITTVQYINPLRDGENDARQGKRIGPGNKVSQVSFPLYALPTEAQGRADTITPDQRNATQRATVRLGARQAAHAQPASVLALVDHHGITWRTRVQRLVWNGGAYELDVVLDDPEILRSVGVAVEADGRVIDPPPPPEAEFLALDLPKLRTADNAPAYLGLVKTTASATGARWFDSDDNVAYGLRASYANDATFGQVTALSGAFDRGPMFDEASTLTVDLGADAAPSSATRAALLASRGLNAFAVGAAGRMVLGQFRTATALGAGVWRFSGLLNMGDRGTEQYCDQLVAGDDFALLGTAGTALIPRGVDQLGATVYTKGVAVGRSAAAVDGVAFVYAGVNLKPLSPVDLRAERDHSSGDILISWTPRTRDDTRFGGDLGDAWAHGEAAELYRVRLYTDASGATLLRDLGTASTPAITYTAAQRAADSHTLGNPIYPQITMVSAVAGEGYPLLEAA